MQISPHGPWWSELPDAAELAVVVLHPDGTIDDVSPHLAALVGKTASALRGQNFIEVLVADGHRERAVDVFLGDAQSSVPSAVIVPVRAAGGAEAHVRWRRVPCGTGRPEMRQIACGIDVTHQIRQEAVIQRSDATVFSYLQASPDAVVITDAAGMIVAFSDGAEIVFRCGRDRMIGRSINELVPERFRAAHGALVEGFVRSGQLARRMAERAEIRACRHTGEEFAAEATIARLPTRQGDLFTAILRDLSERKAYEVALESAKTRAEAANEAKSAFLATMSHEIRTPMNAVLGMLSVLSMESLKPTQREMVEVAIEAGNSLMEILNDILDYSRIDAGQLRLEFARFEIRSVLKKIQTLHGFKAKAAGISFSVDIDPAAPDFVLGDPARLQQILHNLVSNAIKFTPKGSVSVDAHVVRRERDAATLVLDVADTGIGISRDKLAMIFDRFTQADASITRKFGGSGLGLSIVKGIVLAMGGQIDVQSDLGKGAHFTVRIPVQVPAKSPSQPAAGKTLQARAALAAMSLRVLVAEDNVLSADTLKVLLERELVSVSIARSGEEALRLFAPGHYDVVFLDVSMPVLDGESTVKALRKLEDASGSKKSIVIASMPHVDPERSARLRAAGFDHVLAKPVAPDEIDQVLSLARIRLSAVPA